MKVLVIGKGGRKHALIHAVGGNGRVKKVYAVPGNPGMIELAECVNIANSDVEGLTAFAEGQEIDLTMVGPEATLSPGVVDAFQAEGLKIFGPTKDVAQVEFSKDFAKEIVAKYGTPTANYQTFDSKVNAIGYMEHQGVPVMIEGDGLEAGKDITIAYELKEALDAIEVAFSTPGNRAVVKECLEGFGFSLVCFVCGDLVLPMEVAQDHKAAYDGGKGPNIGGMDVYSLVKKITPDITEGMINAVMMPVAKIMAKEGHPFTEFLCDGLMPTEYGAKTIEFNARFGDSEAEAILSGLKTDFCDVIGGIMNHSKTKLKWGGRVTLGVIMASEGYPASSTKSAVTKNLENVNSMASHTGTAGEKGSLVMDGSHVLCMCAVAGTLEEAYKEAYADVYRIHCDKLFYRNDIEGKDM